jgi:hypothetical protein
MVAVVVEQKDPQRVQQVLVDLASVETVEK